MSTSTFLLPELFIFENFSYSQKVIVQLIGAIFWGIMIFTIQVCNPVHSYSMP